MTTIYAGLAMGAIYALVAYGFNIIYVTAAVFNLSQGQLFMAGTFVAFVVTAVFGWPPLLAIPVAAAVMALVAILVLQIAVRPLAPGAHLELVTTLGGAVILTGTVLAIWGPEPHPVPPLFGKSESLSLFGGRVLPTEIVLFIAAIGIAFFLDLFMRRTQFGLANLALAEDREAAMLRGINADRLAVFAFAAAGAVAGAIGALAASRTFALFSIGDQVGIKAFVALVMFGVGSQRAALLGGLIVGLIEALSARWLGVLYGNLIVFVLFLCVLMLRPSGLYATTGQRAV
jgi:branched-chain amino acid transport system permease protein